jgi:hypothetical protein
MGEGIRHHFAAGLPLQGVVADGGGGVQGRFHVAVFNDVARAVGVVGPDAGEAVGLQLQPHRQGVALAFGSVALGVVHLVADAHQVLHVVADFVRHHIGLGEFAGGVEALLEQAEEVEVDVDVLVPRAVERSGGGTAGAAGGLDGAAEHLHLRHLVAGAVAAEQVRPHVFRVGQDDFHQLVFPVVAFRARALVLLLAYLDRAAAAAQQAEDGQGIDAEDPAADQGDHDGADADRPAAKAKTAASAAFSTVVFDVFTLTVAFPAHFFYSLFIFAKCNALVRGAGARTMPP